jgi:hypothetical protein
MIPKECKRLAEVDFPIAVVSKHSAREKSIRHGHPSTLHLWWARRPLAACRAMLMALLLPDPADPHCPKEFKREARRLLARMPGQIEEDAVRIEMVGATARTSNRPASSPRSPGRSLAPSSRSSLTPTGWSGRRRNRRFAWPTQPAASRAYYPAAGLPPGRDLRRPHRDRPPGQAWRPLGAHPHAARQRSSTSVAHGDNRGHRVAQVPFAWRRGR